jgi:hypothetical protein
MDSYNILMDYYACTILEQIKGLILDENKIVTKIYAMLESIGGSELSTNLNIKELYADICTESPQVCVFSWNSLSKLNIHEQ